ncbi:MAG TPA: PD-(D/E)XK nuclease family protein [Chloroflexia bacterium]|nr:PD-(D/E)XK nuclease family protein [Chloroflexia bacterium]
MEIHLTPSKVEMLQNCPLAFQQKYLKGLSEPFRPSPASQLGMNVHAALYAFYQRGAHSNHDVNDLLRLLHTKWDSAGFNNAEDEEAFRQEARQMLIDFYHASKEEAPCRSRMLEKPYRADRAFSLGRHKIWLGGRFDRLDLLADGSVEVLDYKTGAPPSTGLPDEQEMAERLDNLIYYRLAAAIYPKAKNITVSRYYLKSKRKVSALYTAERLHAARDLLLDLLDQLESGIVSPVQNEGCSWCLVRRHGKCPTFAGTDTGELIQF